MFKDITHFLKTNKRRQFGKQKGCSEQPDRFSFSAFFSAASKKFGGAVPVQIGGAPTRALSPRRWGKQKGRSMIEMLGVLAIIGVLSIAALVGFTYAMNKHRANETIYDVMLRGTNVPMIDEYYYDKASGYEFRFPGLVNNGRQGTYYPMTTKKDAGSSYYVEATGVTYRVCELILKMNPTDIDQIVVNNSVYTGDSDICGTTDGLAMKFCFGSDGTICDGTGQGGSGSGDSSGGTSGGSGSGSGTQDCTLSKDCTGTLVCIAGTCQEPDPNTPCVDDTDCPGDQACTSGTCQKPEPCTTSADCEGNLTCTEDGECKNPNPCTLSKDCTGAMVCINGFCQDPNPNEPCSTDADCLGDQTCTNSICEKPTPCTTSTDCNGDLVCVDEECKNPDICYSNEDCPGNLACVDGTCTDPCLDKDPPACDECEEPNKTCTSCVAIENCCKTGYESCGLSCCDPELGESCINDTCCPLERSCGDTCCADGLTCIDGTCQEGYCANGVLVTSALTGASFSCCEEPNKGWNKCRGSDIGTCTQKVEYEGKEYPWLRICCGENQTVYLTQDDYIGCCDNPNVEVIGWADHETCCSVGTTPHVVNNGYGSPATHCCNGDVYRNTNEPGVSAYSCCESGQVTSIRSYEGIISDSKMCCPGGQVGYAYNRNDTYHIGYTYTYCCEPSKLYRNYHNSSGYTDHLACCQTNGYEIVDVYDKPYQACCPAGQTGYEAMDQYWNITGHCCEGTPYKREGWESMTQPPYSCCATQNGGKLYDTLDGGQYCCSASNAEPNDFATYIYPNGSTFYSCCWKYSGGNTDFAAPITGDVEGTYCCREGQAAYSYPAYNEGDYFVKCCSKDRIFMSSSTVENGKTVTSYMCCEGDNFSGTECYTDTYDGVTSTYCNCCYTYCYDMGDGTQQCDEMC